MTELAEPERQQPELCTAGCVHGWHGQRCDWRPKIPGLPPVPPCDCPGAWGGAA